MQPLTTIINIDFHHFCPDIIRYLNTVPHYAKIVIRQDHFADLTNMVFDWLLNRVRNFTVTPCPRSWLLYRYFDKETAIEIFDPLFLDFIDFLREQGVMAERDYLVKRGRQYRCTCTETPNPTPNFP